MSELKKLDFSEKHNTSYCVSNQQRDINVEIAMRKVKGRIHPEGMKSEAIAIVGYAPSLNDTWEEIKGFKYIFTCSGAHKFLLDKGLKPTDFTRWVHNDLDPRPHKVKILGEPQHGIEYYAASTIHPNYLEYLKDYNIKLWHIFSHEEEAMRLLPPGEFSFTGGSDVGMRTMVLARFLGFTNIHVFGMDGCYSEKHGFHAAAHPNQPPHYMETEFNGKKFYVTPALMECAKQFPREVDELTDCNFKFYGDGLVQEIMKGYKRSATKKSSYLWFDKPELISDEYKILNAKLHEDNVMYGAGGARHAELVKFILKGLVTEGNQFPSILDYGCGKGQLGKALGFPIYEYDPAIPGKEESPKASDLVVCTDVLEHIEPDKLDFVLGDLKRCVKQAGLFIISTRQAVKTYANGKNTHLIVKDRVWWEKKLSKYFLIPEKGIVERDNVKEIQVMVAPKIKEEKPKEEITEVNGIKFHTPNELTKWRAETLLTKEPCTIEWLNGMKKDAVFFDVGACIGSYSMIAAKNGLRVYSFEPEPENFAILEKNFELNGFHPSAFCVAASDKEAISELYVTKGGAGQSFHQFGKGESKIKKSCIGMPLDKFLDMGLPHPDYLKIDVDGFEPKVIAGATRILENGLTSLLIEVDTNNADHVKMVGEICEMGFSYDEVQVNKAMRKEGNFKGVAEYIFVKIGKDKSNLPAYEFDNITNAKLNEYPFPYLYTEGFFNHDTYQDILKSLKETEFIEIEKSRGTRGYPLRFTGKPIDSISNFLMSGGFKKALLSKFGIADNNYSEDILLVRDLPGYSIPPHTDSVSKIITVLIYLPEDNSMEEEGTSIYTPKKDGFTCKTGQHYRFEDFEKVKTMPFRPNSMFAFARTDNSFHGVEPSSHIRNVLLYNIKAK